jgi:hypothetical protein
MSSDFVLSPAPWIMRLRQRVAKNLNQQTHHRVRARIALITWLVCTGALGSSVLGSAAHAAPAAVAIKPGSVTPAGSTTPTAAPSNTAEANADGGGTTIVGDKESPIGLFITPWKNAYAERQQERPTRLLDEAPKAIDPATFRRQMEYYQTISDYRREQLKTESPH